MQLKKVKLSIVDGHNRYDICTKHNIPIPDAKIFQKSFSDEGEVKEWVIRNQFGRRNLSIYSRSVLTLKLEEIIAKKAKVKQKAEGKKLLPTLALVVVASCYQCWLVPLLHSNGVLMKIKKTTIKTVKRGKNYLEGYPYKA